MPKIGTHDGKFHCDEAFAIFMLKSLPEYNKHEIVRTRDSDILDKCDIVVDVGGEYSTAAMKYDHHQRDFIHTMNTLKGMNFYTKLSSAGLIYAHFGERVIGTLLGLSHDDPAVDVLYHKIYETFVESIDAVDNGIAQYDGEPRYYLGGTLSNRVSMLNPAWNENQVDVGKRFAKAVGLVGKEFSELLDYLYKSWLPARAIVADALTHRFDVDESGQIFYLEGGGVPWKDHFFSIEKERGLENDDITYVVYADTTCEQWRVQAVPVSEKQPFQSRLPLPSAWRGLRDVELTNVANVSGCVFVHATGFIGGATSFESVVKMAKNSLILAGRYKA